MNKRERVRAALANEAVDRPPYSLWTHLPGIDLDPLRLAEETAGFQARFELDFVKSMPNGLYCVEDWGTQCDYSAISRGGVARVTRAAVTDINDWRTLAPVGIRAGAYGRELRHLEALVKHVGPEVPVLATVFSPLTIAAKLSEGQHQAHLRWAPDKVLPALDIIAEVTCEFLRECVALGCAGMFFATQDATRKAFTEAEYLRFGKTYDDRVLAAAKASGAWFNVLHAHGDDILFDVLKDYDITALNWHIGETAPSIGAYRAAGGTRPIVGGLQRTHLTACDRDATAADIASAIAESDGRGILLAPACVIRHPVDDEMLRWTTAAIRAATA
jgi:uroporphyrinogen decarboxylase